MKALAAVPSSTDIVWAVVEGTAQSPQSAKHPAKIKIPAASDSQALYSALRLFSTLLKEQHPDIVAVLQAGNSQFRGPSPGRVKAEALLQVAAAELGIPVKLVPPQTFRAQEKKFQSLVGNTPEAQLNDRSDFTSQQLRTAALVGWIGLQ